MMFHVKHQGARIFFTFLFCKSIVSRGTIDAFWTNLNEKMIYLMFHVKQLILCNYQDGLFDRRGR